MVALLRTLKHECFQLSSDYLNYLSLNNNVVVGLISEQIILAS